MKSTILLLTFTFLNISFAFGQFKTNSIGVCYLQQDSADYYSLRIVFPSQTLTNPKENRTLDFKSVIDSIDFKGQISLFDKTGEIIRLDINDKFLLEFWCENDGGIQYRPTLYKKINKDKFKLPLVAIYDIQNICCFVIIKRIERKPEFTNLSIAKDIKLLGDYDKDGNID